MNYIGKVIWFYLLPSAGKTTIADLLAKKLRSENPTNPRIQRLDGDIVRQELTKDLGFSLEDRFKNIQRVAFVADLLSQNDICVIASFITPSREIRKYLKDKFGKRLILIWVNTEKELCIKRDIKGLWKLALSGELKDFTGVSSPFDVDEDFDFTISTVKSPEEVVDTLIESLND